MPCQEVREKLGKMKVENSGHPDFVKFGEHKDRIRNGYIFQKKFYHCTIKDNVIMASSNINGTLSMFYLFKNHVK